MGIIQITSHIRGQGLGNKAWIAKIVGPDPNGTFKRILIRADYSGMYNSGRSGSVNFSITEPGIFEYHNFMDKNRPIKDGEISGFWHIKPYGTIEDITHQEVLEMIRSNKLPKYEYMVIEDNNKTEKVSEKRRLRKKQEKMVMKAPPLRKIQWK